MLRKWNSSPPPITIFQFQGEDVYYLDRWSCDQLGAWGNLIGYSRCGTTGKPVAAPSGRR